MSEETAEGTETETTATESTETEPTETVDFWKQKAREQEKRAKENADAAKRLSELEDAQKTETEKTADRIAKAEAEVQAIPSKVADALKAHLIEIHEIDQDDAELFLTATEPELLVKQVTRLLGQTDKRTKKNHVPREGTPTRDPATDELREFTKGLFAAAKRDA